MADPLLRLERLVQQRTGGFRLDISEFTVYPGKSYAITGPNGAGKTALLRTMALLDLPVSGRMMFEGRPVSLTDAGVVHLYRRQVTLVMQHAFLFRTSVFNNVASGLRLRGVSPDVVRPRVLGVLETVGLADFDRRHARQLSSGEAQRVALARALAVQPRLLLLDEPTANVDADHAARIEAVLTRTRSERHMAVVFSTHQMDQAYRLADEVWSLRDGNILHAGPANLFAGQIEEDGQAVRLMPEVVLRVITDRRGPVYVHIPPEEVIISKAPLLSSARNLLRGTLVSATVEDGHIHLSIEAGVRLSARITRQSFVEMGLHVGDPICATFKVSAVHIL
jgi:tungstate transport system ATP-binding protein